MVCAQKRRKGCGAKFFKFVGCVGKRAEASKNISRSREPLALLLSLKPWLCMVSGMRRTLLLLLLATWASTGKAMLTPELQNDLRVLKTIGSEGQGNIEAGVSWKKLAAGNLE